MNEYEEFERKAKAIASVGKQLVERIEDAKSKIEEYKKKADEKEAKGEPGDYYRNWAESLELELVYYEEIEKAFYDRYAKIFQMEMRVKDE